MGCSVAEGRTRSHSGLDHEPSGEIAQIEEEAIRSMMEAWMLALTPGPSRHPSERRCHRSERCSCEVRKVTGRADNFVD